MQVDQTHFTNFQARHNVKGFFSFETPSVVSLESWFLHKKKKERKKKNNTSDSNPLQSWQEKKVNKLFNSDTSDL